MRVFFYFNIFTLTVVLPFEKAAVFRNMYFVVFFVLVKLTIPFKYSNDYLTVEFECLKSIGTPWLTTVIVLHG